VLKEAALSVDDIVQFTRAFTIQVVTHAAYAMSPDPEDNFLFDIALQYKAAVMITDEKALLNFAASPVAIRSLKWFKENFPLP
jgi:predicted nucleic acid-binding protein